MTTGSALPTLPQSVPRGRSILWLHWFASAAACQVAYPPVRIRLGSPGTFTSRLSTDRSSSPLLDITTTATGTPCMGLFLSRSFSRATHLSSFVSFFVRSESPFLHPDPPQRQAVARRSCQGWSPLRRPTAGPGLESSEHGCTIECSRLGQQDDDQRGARVRARIYRATTLYSVGPRTRTMMQSCASVRSSEAADPFSVTA